MTDTLTTTTEPEVEPRNVPHVAAFLNIIGILAGFACIMLIALDVESPIRSILAVVLFSIGPGSGIVQFIKISDAALQLGLVLAISAAFTIIVAQSFLSINDINALGTTITLTVITCIRPIYRRPKPVATEAGETE